MRVSHFLSGARVGLSWSHRVDRNGLLALVLFFLVACSPGPLEDARSAMAVGDTLRAVGAYEQVPAGRLKSSDRLAFAEGLWELGEILDAGRLVEGIPSSDRPLALRHLEADVLMAEAQWEALDSLEESARARGIQEPALWAVLGRGHVQRGDVAAAVGALTLCEPVDIPLCKLLALEAVAVEDSAANLAALLTLARHPDSGPSGAEAFAHVIWALLAEGQGGDALAIGNEAALAHPRHPAIHGAFGAILLAQGDIERGLALMEGAWWQRRWDAPLMGALARAWGARAREARSQSARLASLTQAERWAARSIEHPPRSAEALTTWGAALEALGDEERALNAYREAVQLAPGAVDGVLSLGRFYAGRGQLEMAQTVFMEGLSLQPDHVILTLNLGVLALRQGDADGATQWLDRSEQLCARYGPQHPCQAQVAYNQSRRLSRGGNIESGAEYLIRALELGYRDIGRLRAEPDLSPLLLLPAVAGAIEARERVKSR